ncbi:MAG: SdpI family protein [Butyrivibrio sp.]|nr:SdpI family protein [Butyrivibrio sp.]
MGFWIFVLISELLCPGIMIFFGKKFMKKAPKHINNAFGYRTKRSMQNKDTWAFAHSYFGKIWYICGLALLPITIIPMFFMLGKDYDQIGNFCTSIIFVQMILLIGAIAPTEYALSKRFSKRG